MTFTLSDTLPSSKPALYGWLVEQARPLIEDETEIVVPLVAADGALIGSWDVDSPRLARFDDADAAGIEALCRTFVESAWSRRKIR